MYCTIGVSAAEAVKGRQYNVLFIMCDDLNDYVSGFDGHPQARTPAMERLAETGTSFTRAYTNYPVCVPSRNSFINGIYPHNGTSCWMNWTKNATLRDSKTMMAYFRDNGYTVVGSGKIDHYSNRGEWSRYYNSPDYGPFWQKGGKNVAHPEVKAPFCEIGAVDGSFGALEDAPWKGLGQGNGWYYAAPWKKKAKKVIRDPELGWMTPDKKNALIMKNLLSDKSAGLEEPFFMGVGFIRPHTPLHVERKFFDMFPLEDIKLSPVRENDEDDTHLKDLVDRSKSKGYRYYDAITKSYGSSEAGLKRFAQAYLASVRAVDANIDVVLTALDNSAYRDNTIVIVTSDHGWQMGEKKFLFKGSLWEESARIPLIVRVPGMTRPGTRCDHPISLIDIYPSLIDLCGLEGSTVRGENGRQLDGSSIRPFLEDPQNGRWNGPDAALTMIRSRDSQWGKENDLHFSVRSKHYRYIRYSSGKEELYDHRTDPHEWTNLAANPELKAVREQHLESLCKISGLDLRTGAPAPSTQ